MDGRAPRVARRAWLAVVAVSALAALAAFELTAGAVLEHGLPLDDSWIHLVYARELGRSGMLAYNPGEPSTGATSPLWPMVLAPLQWLGTTAAGALGAKLLAFAFHLLACLGLVTLLRAESHAPLYPVALAASLVAVHPDIVAASVSGMEVGLAAACCVLVALAVRANRVGLLALASFLVFLARPEFALIGFLLPLLYLGRDRPRRALVMAAAGLAGGTLAFLGVAIRSVIVSGLPLPATFFVKVGEERSLPALIRGMWGLGDALVGLHPLLAIGALGIALVVCFRRRESEQRRMAAALVIAGIAAGATSIYLVSPIDPTVLYFQRYLLPAAPLFFGGFLGLLIRRGSSLRSQLPVLVATGVLGAVALANIPSRASRLANDARNIDDVQVAIGRHLGELGPQTIWTTDAGAVRRFAEGYVVDMNGLNSPSVLRPSERESYLAEHPPDFLVLMEPWSALADVTRVTGEPGDLPVARYRTETPYTVTRTTSMREQALVRCLPGYRGHVIVKGQRLPFTCDPGP